VIRRSEHADFQSNAVLALGKRARTGPADLAAAVSEALRADSSTPVTEVTVSGPGFLNLTLADSAL
jgi:arginyl-tRNA synthetase